MATRVAELLEIMAAIGQAQTEYGSRYFAARGMVARNTIPLLALMSYSSGTPRFMRRHT